MKDRSGKDSSRIFFGTAMPPFISGGDGSELLDGIYAAGINAFDTARGYMGAEKSLGQWIEKRGIRDKVVILSKGGAPSLLGRKRINEADIRKDLEKSAACLQTDHIDIYLLHRDDPDIDAGIAVEILNALHAEGRIGLFGGSNWTHRRIMEANEYAYKHGLLPFSVSSPNFGLADQCRNPWGGGCVTISGPANEEARAWYIENQMPVIAYSSLGRGFFSGKLKSSDEENASKILDAIAVEGYVCPENFERLRRCEKLALKKGTSVPQIALAWLFRQKLNVYAVISTSSPVRMKDDLAALKFELSDDELLYLDLLKEDCSI